MAPGVAGSIPVIHPILSAVALWMIAAPALAQPSASTAPAYLKAIPGRTTAWLWPILTAGDSIPRTGEPGTFLVVGIPDGLGLARTDRDHLILLSNHEFPPSAGDPAGPLRGGARVSEFTLRVENDGAYQRARAESGRSAIERVYDASGVQVDTCRFAKFCSATLADQRVGFDSTMFLTGEEWGRVGSFDGKGGLAFAVFNGGAHALPRLGRFRKENQVPIPGTGTSTVVLGLEDDDDTTGTRLLSQLYMYVGRKQPESSDALAVNGLRNGELYVFAAHDAIRDEETFRVKGKSLTGHWAHMNWNDDDGQLERAAQASNAFNMVRLEDGAANPARAGEFWFVTTGDPARDFNSRGRLYRLNFDVRHPTGPATLTLVLDGSEGIVSPDNIDVNRHGELAICEDPNLDPGRGPRLWIYEIRSRRLTAVAEADTVQAHRLLRGHVQRDSLGRPPRWELSGVVDAEDYLGRGSWILDVQAHSLRVDPVRRTVEGGQYLQVVWKPK